jgi:hypothetical protein
MIERHFDFQAGLVRTTMSGHVTGEHMREHFEAVRDLGAGRCLELVDARGVSNVSLTSGEMPGLASAGREIFSRDHVAPRAVVVSGVVHFGIGCFFAVAAAPWVQIHMFESLELAETWLLKRSAAWPFPATFPRANAPARARLRLVSQLDPFSL